MNIDCANYEDGKFNPKIYYADGTQKCSCGCDKKIISKKMFYDFLSNFPEISGEATIYSVDNWSTGKIKIIVEVIQDLGDKKWDEKLSV